MADLRKRSDVRVCDFFSEVPDCPVDAELIYAIGFFFFTNESDFNRI